MIKKILVTAISGDVGNSVLKCLKDSNIQLYGCDVNEYPAGMDRVITCFKVPYARDEKYIKTLLNLCAENNITHLIPVNEEEIIKTSKEKALFEKHNIKVLVHDMQFLDVCMDKYMIIRDLASGGISVPDSYVPDEFKPDGNEYIAKLRYSSGSKLVERFKTEDTLKEIALKFKEQFIIQQYIPSDETEFTVGVFSDGVEVRSIIFRRRLLNGYTKFVELVKDDSIERLAEKVINHFGIIGCINIQLRKYNNTNYIFEINPRISGTAYFRHQLGFEDVIWWLNVVSQENIKDYHLYYDKAIGVREMAEKFLILSPPSPPPPNKRIELLLYNYIHLLFFVWSVRKNASY